MKRRTFYIINLDRNRLFIITVMFVGLLAAAYATGFRFGRTQGPAAGMEALTHQDLMGLPEDTGSAALEGSGIPGGGDERIADLADLPAEHPLNRSNPDAARTSSDGRGINARDLGSGASGELPRLDRQPNAALAPTPLSRLGEPETARLQGRNDRSAEREKAERRARQKEQEKIQARKEARKKAQAKARAEEKRRKRAEAKAKRERDRRERQIAARKKRERDSQVATRLTDKRRESIGQTFQNKGRSRLSFEKQNSRKNQARKSEPEKTAKRSPDRKARTTDAGTSKRTLSLRNVSPSQKEKRPESSARKKREREYSLQLGSFSSRDSAFRMASSLKRQGFNPYVYRSGGKFAVRVGKTDQPGHLETLEQRLRRKRYSPMRISYKKPQR